MISMDGERARKVITRAMPRSMGRFVSRKSERTLHWESQIERDFCYHLEFDPVVFRFREQPITVELPNCGFGRRYTPDFYVERREGRFIYEVKPAKQVQSGELDELFEAARDFFSEHGIHYEVVTEVDLREQPFLHNIKLLLKYSGIRLLDQTVASAKSIVRRHGAMPLWAVAECLPTQDDQLLAAFSLVSHGHLTADLRAEKLTARSIVRGE
jgi:hypothetical protein